MQPVPVARVSAKKWEAYLDLHFSIYPVSLRERPEVKVLYIYPNGDIKRSSNVSLEDAKEEGEILRIVPEKELTFCITFDCHIERGILAKDVSSVLEANKNQKIISIYPEG